MSFIYSGPLVITAQPARNHIIFFNRLTLFNKLTIKKLHFAIICVIQQRGGFEKKIEEPKDFLDTLIKMKQEADAEGKGNH